MEFFHETRIDFLRWRRVALAVSGLAIAVGLTSLAIRGGPRLGMDFRGGSQVHLAFPVPVTTAELRASLAPIGLTRAEIKQYGSPREFLVRTDQVEDPAVLARALVERLAREDGWGTPEVRSIATVGARVGGELRASAVAATIALLLLILLYISLRFRFVFAVGAVVALVHDVLVTLGVFSLFDREIDLSVVAAFLTLAGYSINDTIVVLDRVRESLRTQRARSGSISETVNRSINQTLSRTILTSGTTLISVLSLYVLGGPTLRDFAFCLLVGIVTGTYSSIYIAAPIIVEWYDRRRARRSRPSTPGPSEEVPRPDSWSARRREQRARRAA